MEYIVNRTAPITEHDQIGQRFGKCVFVAYRLRTFTSLPKRSHITCVCDCGKKFQLNYLRLNPKMSYSCKKCKGAQ